jgi:hypothetical protein
MDRMNGILEADILKDKAKTGLFFTGIMECCWVCIES